MVFCGQCGYQLSPGESLCPHCGAKTEADLIQNDPGIYNPTEISHAVLERSRRPQAAPQRNPNSQPPRTPIQSESPEAGGPLVLGSDVPNEQLANEITASGNSQVYASPQVYSNYPQQAVTGLQGNYAAGVYPPPYQGGQSAAVARLLASSHRGKTGALLLILCGLLLLTGAIVILLLTLKHVIFTA